MKIKNRLIMKINENPGINSIDLSNEFFLTKGCISLHLKKLESKDLIERYKIYDNKKNLKIHPTKKGKDLYLKLKKEIVFKKK